MGSFTMLSNLVAEHFRDQSYRHRLLRLGMMINIDPTPFVLAEEHVPFDTNVPETKIISRIGEFSIGSFGLFRLYFDDVDDEFLQIGIEGNMVTECRFFSRVDEILPQSADEWGFWVDPVEGLITKPTFAFPDEGLDYARVWAPGVAAAAPLAVTETLRYIASPNETVTQIRGHAMQLYGVDTDLPAPAPQQKWLLVSAAPDTAIMIHAGINLLPTTLGIE